MYHISRVKKGWDAKLLFGESEDELAVPGEWKIMEFGFGKKWIPKTKMLTVTGRYFSLPV